MPNNGFPVVISPNGAPVVSVVSGAPLATVAENGLGSPITLVESGGVPLVIQGGEPPSPVQWGAMDYVALNDNGLDNFSREFDLASDCIVVELACQYSGDPVIEIAHGGEPLTIVNQSRSGPLLGLIAVGTGMTQEAADFTINVTGGHCNQGAIRVNEMVGIQPELVGWSDEQHGQGSPAASLTVGPTDGGVIKGIFFNTENDQYHRQYVENTEIMFDGYMFCGTNVDQDFTPSGPWVIGGEGWSIDGESFVHTGLTEGTLTIQHPPATRRAGARCIVDVESGSVSLRTASVTVTYRAPAKGLISCGAVFGTTSNLLEEITITATGNCTVRDISVVSDGTGLAWTFFRAPAIEGTELKPIMWYRPEWGIMASEILGEDY